MPNRALPATDAAARMRAAGLTPIEPYPDTSRRPWRASCNTCGAIVSPTASSVGRGHGCNACGARRGGRRNSIDESEAIRRLRAAGWEPLEPYPGTRLAAWRAQCTGCGATATSYLKTIEARQGLGCDNCRRVHRLD